MHTNVFIEDMITILIACVFDCMMISGKMDKVSMASFYGQPLCRFSQSVCLASRASKVNLTRTEKAQHERKQKAKKKLKMLCITNFKKSELYGNSQASLEYKKKKKKLTLMVNAVLFQVNTSMMRSFCKETLLLPLFSSFFAERCQQNAFASPYTSCINRNGVNFSQKK